MLNRCQVLQGHLIKKLSIQSQVAIACVQSDPFCVHTIERKHKREIKSQLDMTVTGPAATP